MVLLCVSVCECVWAGVYVYGRHAPERHPAECVYVCVCVCVWLSVCVLIHIGHCPLSQSSNQCHGLGLTSSVHTYGSGGDASLLSPTSVSVSVPLLSSLLFYLSSLPSLIL